MNEKPQGFFALKPRRLLDWQLDAEGKAVLLRPKFGSGVPGRFLSRWFGPSHYRIRLDSVGTAVWLGLDGEKPLAALLRELRKEFGSRVEPADQRLKLFIDDMIRKRLIEVA